MIQLSRLNGGVIAINPDLVTWIEVTPDTTIEFLNGDRIMVRESLDEVMDRVVSDCDHTVITRQGSEPVVMLSLSEWNAIQETSHLLSSPRNAARLASAIAQLDSGKGVERDPSELRKLAD